jgi:AGCS family alanine or glycine:cation symporter
MSGGGAVLSASICVFAYSTVLGWSVYGLRAAEYLGGRRGEGLYRAAFVASLYIGAVLQSESVWALSDALNALMAVPNLIAVFMLSGETGRTAKKRFSL